MHIYIYIYIYIELKGRLRILTNNFYNKIQREGKVNIYLLDSLVAE